MSITVIDPLHSVDEPRFVITGLSYPHRLLVADRFVTPQMFSVNPIWDDLRDDTCFADLIRKVEQLKLD